MPRRIVSPRVRSGVSTRRRTAWASVEFGPTGVPTAATPVLVASFSNALLAGDAGPMTWIRTRGVFFVHSDQTVAVEDILGVLSLGVVSEPARVAGVGSIPSPITEAGDESFAVYEPFAITEEAPSAGESKRNGITVFVDSKAMRKVEDSQGIALVAEGSSNTDGFTIYGLLRLLFKLH